MKTEALQTLSAIMSLQIQLCFLFLIYLLVKVDGNVKLQQKMSLIKALDKTVVIDCNYPSDCRDYIHWYQLKEGKPLTRVLYSGISSTTTSNDAGFESFTIDRKPSNLALKIRKLKEEHSAVYYCACWISGGTVSIFKKSTRIFYNNVHKATADALLHKLHLFVQEQMTVGYRKVFGSGTRLYVTDPKSDTVKTPKLTGYLPSKKSPDNHGKQTMLCHASDMFPDLVTFKWQEKSGGGEWTDASEENVVEQRKESKPVTVTSMMIVDKNMALNKDFKCIVTHEGITGDPQILEMKEENSKPAKESEGDDQNTVACTPSAEEPLTKQISGDSEQIPSMFLFVYAYGVLLMKNGLFFSVVSIFLLKRKAGRKDKSSET